MQQDGPVSEEDQALLRLVTSVFDADWYRKRHLDVGSSGFQGLEHFMKWGLLEKRDPNAFFDSAWYSEHYPDVRDGKAVPLIHYLRNGAAELRNPHPQFDAAWYVEQHPEAASNPLLYHIKIGVTRKYPTIRPINIDDYFPATPQTYAYPNRLRVDVIIPVYRGLEETQACIESVLANTAEPLGRIIVVEDCSPEPALVDWLQTAAATGRIHLIRNARNLGFVRSVNIGMREAGKNDVVLLNSDTEVPPHWLQRLARQAYASRKIASVSPFSNNATICSYPALAGGPLAFGRSVSDIDTACQSVNAGRWVDVPTTVGFCMYIRRAALDRVGLFDAERFKMGYGEENDFCLRASALGWSHRLACDTFVYHKGSVSFLDRTTKLSKRAAQLIEERFPTYHRDIANHIALAKADPFRFAVTADLLRSAVLPVILMVMHDLGGGILRHMDIVTERCVDRANVVYFLSTDRGAELSVPTLPGHPKVALPAGRMDDLIRLLRSMAISRVHVHHLLGMDFDIRSLIHRLGVPFDVTVHDYQALCPHINLTPWRHSLYCGEPEAGACNTCIVRRYAYANADIITWRMAVPRRGTCAVPQPGCHRPSTPPRLRRPGGVRPARARHRRALAEAQPPAGKRRTPAYRGSRHTRRPQGRTQRRRRRRTCGQQRPGDPPDRRYRRSIPPHRSQADEDHRRLQRCRPRQTDRNR